MTDALGMWLRRARETQHLEFADVEKKLRIRRRYLQALEVGDYASLPGEIQTRGFLRNYARFLGLPVEDAMARYDSEVLGRPMQPRSPVYTQPARESSGLRSWAPPPPSIEEEARGVRTNTSSSLMRMALALIAVFAIIAIGSFLWLQFGESLTGVDPTPVVDDTSGAVSISTPVTVDRSETPIPQFPVSSDGIVRVRIVADNSTWISVSADGQVVFQGTARADQVLEAEATDRVIVATGNGAAFKVFINGVDWGTLGGQGVAVRRAWTPAGEATMEGN